MKGKINWQDFKVASQHELKKTYKVSDRQLEVQLRNHLDGASDKEKQKAYKEFYDRRK